MDRTPPRLRVMVIDDDPLMGDTLAALLARHFDVTVERDPRSALVALLDEPAGPVDAVLCDLVMPGMVGPELHRHLLAGRPELARRTVFVTGGSAVPELVEFETAMAAEGRLVRKPPRTAELVQTLETVAAA